MGARTRFPQPRWGAHFSGRAQERLLNAAAAHDAHVTGLKSAYVRVILQACEHGITEAVHQIPHRRPIERPSLPERYWEALDAINLEDVFQKRFGVLQSCPHQFKGRFRNASRMSLLERHDAVVAGDHQRQIRVWKAFTLLPFMLLRRPQRQRNVGKDELCARFDKFGAGQWAELLEEAQHSVASSHNRIPTEDTMERRADAALRKVKVGEVSRARQCLTGATADVHRWKPGPSHRKSTISNQTLH